MWGRLGSSPSQTFTYYLDRVKFTQEFDSILCEDMRTKVLQYVRFSIVLSRSILIKSFGSVKWFNLIRLMTIFVGEHLVQTRKITGMFVSVYENYQTTLFWLASITTYFSQKMVVLFTCSKTDCKPLPVQAISLNVTKTVYDFMQNWTKNELKL